MGKIIFWISVTITMLFAFDKFFIELAAVLGVDNFFRNTLIAILDIFIIFMGFSELLEDNDKFSD